MEKTEEKMLAAATKLDKASTACDDSERAKKVFQSKAEEDEKRIAGLEKDLKDARDKAETADITYEVEYLLFNTLLYDPSFNLLPRTSPRSWPSASRTWRRPRSAQMWGRLRSSSWRRS